MTDNVREFKKPAVKAMIPTPPADERPAMFDNMLAFIAEVEKESDFVGFSVVVLYSGGRRRSRYATTYAGRAQLARQVRNAAAEIVKEHLQEK